MATPIIIAFTAFLITPAAFAQQDYIDFTKPFLRKIPVAVPYFKPLVGEEDTEITEKSAELLASYIDFTGLFEVKDRAAYLFDNKTGGIIGPEIDYPNWRAINAELLITGGVKFMDQTVILQLRLFDTVKQEFLIGKQYSVWKKDVKKAIRKFSGEVVHHLTGDYGNFDSRLAFISKSNGKKEIFICDFDGTSIKQFTKTNSLALNPAWSSDSKWIAYTSYERNNPDLFIKHLNGEKKLLSSKKGINTTPAWIPGKFALAATLSFSGDQEIYLLTGSGKIIKKLTSKWGIDVSPTWSPDGKKMAFVSNRSGDPQIYILDIETKRVERQTFTGKYNTQPAWSPKGDKLAFSSMDNGHFNIYFLDVETKKTFQLTKEAGDNESPTWSPDGSLLAFSSTREGVSRIYVMTAYGTDQRRLITIPGQQSQPSWSSRGLK